MRNRLMMLALILAAAGMFAYGIGIAEEGPKNSPKAGAGKGSCGAAGSCSETTGKTVARGFRHAANDDLISLGVFARKADGGCGMCGGAGSAAVARKATVGKGRGSCSRSAGKTVARGFLKADGCCGKCGGSGGGCCGKCGGADGNGCASGCSAAKARKATVGKGRGSCSGTTGKTVARGFRKAASDDLIALGTFARGAGEGCGKCGGATGNSRASGRPVAKDPAARSRK